MGISGPTELRKSQEEEEVQVRRQADGRSPARGLLNEVGLGKVQSPGECRRQKAKRHSFILTFIGSFICMSVKLLHHLNLSLTKDVHITSV